MPMGEFILDRWIVKAIKQICLEKDISLTSYSDDWLLELSKDGAVQRILGYKFPLNSGVSAQTAEDKVAAYTILSSRQVPAVPHALVRTKTGLYDEWLKNGWKDIVVKPLIGTSGYGVRRFHDSTEASTWIDQQSDDGWAVSPFVDIKREIRLIILDNEILLTYEKQPVMLNNLLMFNLGLGATPKDITVSEEIKDLALKASQALQLRLAAIDVIELKDGSYQILEINDGVMMEHYVQVSPEYKAAGYKVYQAIVEALFPTK